ncbi:LLM class flavin-dependent oxidoreductase [Lichenicoccus sp.]|uniref:LLM class flavin-dependent oxidoreductase n=1 Tax=Lichenicoccus sp. TaxID=2781899 RepID=UPI003D13B52A
MPSSGVQFGLDTFGDVTRAGDDSLTPQAQVIREVVEEAVLADALGIEFFGVGEHHRSDFAISSPEMVLAAAASRTEHIRLGSAVTVLSSDEPVRVFQRFSTLDAVSKGRAEVILGRGSFTESFPLFGLPLENYEELFEDKLDLFAALISELEVTWQGRLRAPLTKATVYPRPEAPLTTWVGVGGSPQSIVRAAQYGLPVMLAIIGGDPIRFQPYAELFRGALLELGKEPQPIGVHSPGHVAATDAEALDRFWPHYREMHDRIGAQRGWAPITRDAFEREVDAGSLYLGSADTVARKIARTVQLLKPQRFQLKYSAGTLPHAAMMDTIERYGRDVIPRVRELLAAPSSFDEAA